MFDAMITPHKSQRMTELSRHNECRESSIWIFQEQSGGMVLVPSRSIPQIDELWTRWTITREMTVNETDDNEEEEEDETGEMNERIDFTEREWCIGDWNERRSSYDDNRGRAILRV